VEVIEPPGMQLLVDQVRDAVRAAWRRPQVGSRRVIVVDQADRLNPNAQNAFLKGLEEPPPSTVLILVAGGAEALLDTVRSRCREVVFAALSETRVAAILRDEGANESWARVGGTLERARRLASDEVERSRRAEVAARVLAVTRDAGDAVESAEWLARETRSVRDHVAAARRAELDELGDWIRETKRASQERERREQRRAEQDALESALDDVTSVLRDLLARVASPDAELINRDLATAVSKRASALPGGADVSILECLSAVEDARRRLRANGNVQLVVESLFLSIHERLGA
jgi:DNA polymerase-3 subunit delta'